MNTAKRQKRGAKLVQRMMGPELAERVRQAWRDICPDFESYVVEFLAGEIWSRPGMDLRTRSLVTVAALTATGRTLGLELNMRMALNNGASRQDLVETLLQLAPYAGFPATWEALTLANKVFQEVDGAAKKKTKTKKKRK
jgi:4-carboxymuconolactone decarboxylase